MRYLVLIFYLVLVSAVAADSPQFSSLVAKCAPAEWKGTALIIVNCLGFSLTVVSHTLPPRCSGEMERTDRPVGCGLVAEQLR